MQISINKLTEGINAKAHRKDNHFFRGYRLISFKDGVFSETLDVRFYATNTTMWCCLWGSIAGKFFNGSGKASGYGYDKVSSAFDYALQSAGFNVNYLAGTGQNEDAIHAIAALANLPNYHIVNIHG